MMRMSGNNSLSVRSGVTEVPFRSFRPTVFWSWNGEMEQDEIRRQVRSFAEQGIGGVFLHARAGLKIGYLGEDWMQAVGACIEACGEFGVDVWLYDENGWPSGFGGGAVNALGRSYQVKKLYASETFPEDGEDLVAMYVRKPSRGTASADRISGSPDASEPMLFEETDDRAKAEWFVCYSRNPGYVDLMESDVTRVFLESTHEKYRECFSQFFGNIVKGVFTDEPQLSAEGYPFSFRIGTAYAELTGRRLESDLWKFFRPSEDAERFRHDYFEVVARLVRENFTRQYRDWCERNGLMLTGHFAVEDGICYQPSCNGGVMPHYESMHLPGIDHLGRRLAPIPLMKQLSSVKNQLGMSAVISETFGCSGWNVSWNQLAWIWGYQASLGVNLPCLHLSAYTLEGRRKRDYPPCFSYQQPWWKDFKFFAQWMENVNRSVSEGESCADVLVVLPITGARCERMLSERMTAMSADSRMLAEHLADLQIDFDFADETILAEYASAGEGVLRVGRCIYSTVLLPELGNIEESTLKLLERFRDGGGRIAFVRSRPELLGGIRSDAGIARIRALSDVVMQNRRGIFEKAFDSVAYRREVGFRTGNDRSYTGGLTLNIRKLTDGVLVLAANNEPGSAKHCLLCFAGEGRIVERDCLTGGERVLDSVIADGETSAEVSFGPMESRVFLLKRFETSESEAGGTESSETECDRSAEVSRFADSCRFAEVSRFTDSRSLDARAKRIDPNCLTLDTASLSVDGESFSEEIPVIRIPDLLYRRLNGKGGAAVLRFRFVNGLKRDQDFGTDSKLTLVCETSGVKAIAVNGESVGAPHGWWLDRCMSEFELARLIRSGSNEIDLTFEIPAFDLPENFDDLHQSERNVFRYPIEPENIYLRGEFSVVSDRDLIRTGQYFAIDGKRFGIAPPTELDAFCDFTAQGMPFFRGEVEISGTFAAETRNVSLDLHGGKAASESESAGSERVLFRLGSLRCPAAELFINGEFAGMIWKEPFSLDVTDRLRSGENEFCIRLLSGNRNLLGPHHHWAGDTAYCAPESFTGDKTYGDYVVNAGAPIRTWTDRYWFVGFGVGELVLERYRTDRKESVLSKFGRNICGGTEK